MKTTVDSYPHGFCLDVLICGRGYKKKAQTTNFEHNPFISAYMCISLKRKQIFFVVLATTIVQVDLIE